MRRTIGKKRASQLTSSKVRRSPPPRVEKYFMTLPSVLLSNEYGYCLVFSYRDRLKMDGYCHARLLTPRRGLDYNSLQVITAYDTTTNCGPSLGTPLPLFSRGETALSERGSSFVLHDRSFLALACKACYSETAFYRTGRVRSFREGACFLLEASTKCI